MSKEEIEEKNEPRYRAPALDKGLDILELLAGTKEPLTVTAIVKALGRSTGELFRMVQVLEHRGYIERQNGSEGYQLSSKLFSLGMIQPPVRSLIEIALPKMNELARITGQSCHLAIHSQGQIVVVARIEARADLGFSVRVGYRKAMIGTTSGLILYAFQDADTRGNWERFFKDEGEEALAAFRKRADSVRQIGYVQNASGYVAAVTDLSAPIMSGNSAVAALTIPYVQFIENKASLEEALLELNAMVKIISSELVAGNVGA